MAGAEKLVKTPNAQQRVEVAAERTSYAREVVEMALAHAIGDKVEAAYRRGDLFEKRRRLMADWARSCGTPGGTDQRKVVALRPGAGAT